MHYCQYSIEHFSVNYAGWSIIFYYKNLCGCGYAAIITKKGKKKKSIWGF